MSDFFSEALSSFNAAHPDAHRPLAERFAWESFRAVAAEAIGKANDLLCSEAATYEALRSEFVRRARLALLVEHLEFNKVASKNGPIFITEWNFPPQFMK